MKRTDFNKITTFKDEDSFISSELKIGDTFLYGENVIKQLDNKKKGDSITYYEVIKVKQNGFVSYKPVITTLED